MNVPMVEDLPVDEQATDTPIWDEMEPRWLELRVLLAEEVGGDGA